MKDRQKILMAVICVMVMIAAPVAAVSSYSDASDTGELMLDEGNGATYWYSMNGSTGTTYAEKIKSVLESNGHVCTVTGTISIDGKTSCQIGTGTETSSDPLNVPGLSSKTVVSNWKVFSWSDNKWVITDPSSAYSSGTIAVGFYPDGTVPAETPTHQAVTCIGYDAKNSSSQTADISSEKGQMSWGEKWYGEYSGIYSQILTADGYAFIKYGMSTNGKAVEVCRSLNDGSVKWQFVYEKNNYELVSSIIVGNYIYIQSTNGCIYKIDWKNSIGDAVPVKTLTGIKAEIEGLPSVGNDAFGSGLTSMVYDSGAIFLKASNGMIYCFDLDLNPIWSTHVNGKAYSSQVSIYGDYVFAGMLDGHLYILNKTNGQIIADQLLYEKEYEGEMIGNVGTPTVFVKDSTMYVYVTYNDGLGMSAQLYGIALFTFDGTALTKIIQKNDEYGSIRGTTHVKTDGFEGVYFTSGKGLYKMDLSGNTTLLRSDIHKSHADLVLVNNQYLIATSYTKGEPVCQYDLSGELKGIFLEDSSLCQYCMSSVTVIDGMYLYGNDASAIFVKGGFNDPHSLDPVVDTSMPLWQTVLIVIGVIIAIIAVLYCVMRFGLKWEHPWKHITGKVNRFLFGENYSHNTLRRHRLWLVMGIGILLTLCAAIASLCIGPTATLSVGEMFSSLFSAIGKGGNDLTYNELMVYSARLPRTIAAIAVGIGLSVAGAIYQAIIRNPLVDPYIMGVSSGAGTAAIAVIAFDFTFFGLFPPHSIYLTAITAAIGGILAFVCTMLLANKSGGSSVNYVLAGVVVGLVFSAIQTLMLTFAGNQVTGALSWLYGSFAQITWQKVWLVTIPALALSLASLFWAKEFNLVLLGEDNARQMGLNVKKFNRWMLILASVLTAICVAFVGIIGFVGLVIPHLCRMMLGGDHRLVLPASMAFGGFLMIIADLAARMLVPGLELPVGAITTIIGVPVFAWLLIKRGKMYDG